MKIPIVIEKTSTGFSAYSPDIPGCGATGATLEKVKANLQDAILFHLEGMAEAGEELPKPSTVVDSLDIKLAA